MTTGTLDAGRRRAIGTKRSMICRLLLALALALVVAPGWAQESLLDVVLKRDKVMVATCRHIQYLPAASLCGRQWQAGRV
jgi:hypothetical protein